MSDKPLLIPKLIVVATDGFALTVKLVALRLPSVRSIVAPELRVIAPTIAEDCGDVLVYELVAFKVAPLATVIADETAPADAKFNLPADTVIAPEALVPEFPESVTVPKPVFSIVVPDPELITPEKVAVPPEAAFNVAALILVILPEKVEVPAVSIPRVPEPVLASWLVATKAILSRRLLPLVVVAPSSFKRT